MPEITETPAKAALIAQFRTNPYLMNCYVNDTRLRLFMHQNLNVTMVLPEVSLTFSVAAAEST